MPAPTASGIDSFAIPRSGQKAFAIPSGRASETLRHAIFCDPASTFKLGRITLGPYRRLPEAMFHIRHIAEDQIIR